MLNEFKNMFKRNKKTPSNSSNYYMYNLESAKWSPREYSKFADEAYIKNVIANRCINMIASAAASVPWHLHQISKNKKLEIKTHPLLSLLHKPNPLYAGSEFFENIYAYKMISGNAYILAVGSDNQAPLELHLLRPDRVTIIPGNDLLPSGYCYDVGVDKKLFYPIDKISAKSRVLHLRNFHPLDDLYGLSTVESAAYSIDQHNQSSVWNQSLLQNGARPSGALVIKGEMNNLSETQFKRLKEQVDDSFAGAKNSGRPLLLEGGLEWREMSLTPKDMDFIQAKNSAARDIALAFGVPPQLLGIPGDNTYSNMQEARIGLWEDTILPMLDHLCDALNNWLVPYYGDQLKLSIDKDEISALSSKREGVWGRITEADFMSVNEKRHAVG
jgi:HK97 family phage portal protein